MSTPLVRLASAADAAAVGALLHDFNTEFGDPTPGAHALAARIVELMSIDTSVIVGRSGADGLDGLAVLRFRPSIWTPNLECYLAELYVAPAERGNGLGRALMLAAMDHARERGADYMDLGTDETDTAARALYESLGFDNHNGRTDGPTSYFYERDL
ncbi:MAG TPA: GNAT family N-acetyltransferase [Jatrophihabitans sp.]|jgi:ribosomal protein S18 acetylase RimI-like enzyme